MTSQALSGSDFFLAPAEGAEEIDAPKIQEGVSESFTNNRHNHILVLGYGLSEEVLNPITKQLSDLSPQIRFLLIENNYEVAFANLKASDTDIEIGGDDSYVYGTQTKTLIINLGSNPDGDLVVEFLNRFPSTAEIEEVYLIVEADNKVRNESVENTAIKLPFLIFGADRTSPEVSAIVNFLTSEYPNIEKLEINHLYEVTYASIHLMDPAAVLDPQNRFIYSPADGLLALNLHAFSEGETILKWLKDFPYKEQIFEVQLNSLSIREREIEKITEMLKSLDEMKHFDPSFMEEGNIKKVAEYILDTPDCYDLRSKANLKALKFIKT